MARPEPPHPLPPGRILDLPGRGETLLRDSGGDGPPVLLLHGWMFSADLNWWPVYPEVQRRGARVLAIDHRGHGRGIRSPEPFTLEDCADDAATLIRELDCGPVTAVGYSMGGPIACLLARRHPDLVRGLVCCATSSDWRSSPQLRVLWRAMGILRLGMATLSVRFWRTLLAQIGAPAGDERDWTAAELSRGDPVDLAEAGRELGRYDARPWLGDLGVASAVVATTQDRSVPPAKQRELAERLRARRFDVAAGHEAVVTDAERFRPVLLDALGHVGAFDDRAAGAARAAA